MKEHWSVELGIFSLCIVCSMGFCLGHSKIKAFDVIILLLRPAEKMKVFGIFCILGATYRGLRDYMVCSDWLLWFSPSDADLESICSCLEGVYLLHYVFVLPRPWYEATSKEAKLCHFWPIYSLSQTERNKILSYHTNALCKDLIWYLFWHRKLALTSLDLIINWS